MALDAIFWGGSMREFLDLGRALIQPALLSTRRLPCSNSGYSPTDHLHIRAHLALGSCKILSSSRVAPIFSAACVKAVSALEIALQLQAQGREVALLAQFDTPVNGYWRKRRVDWVMHGASLIYSRRLIPRMRERRRARLASRVAMSPEEETYAHILNETWQAIRAYRPERIFQGEIQIFRAPRPPTWFREDAVAGWHTRASRDPGSDVSGTM
jgi:hypothetical protein